MINIMVVDDESIFREFLRTTIDWTSYGFEIVCEAKNGIEALEQVELHRLDIVLVDINMPFMDGITLSEKLLKWNPAIRIVLITGHSEFEYARKAIRLGVEDYILKPFSKEELLITLMKLQQQIEMEKEEKTTAESNRIVMKERLFNQLISREYNGKDTETLNQMKYLGIPVYSGLFKISCIEIDHMDQKWGEINEKLLWKFAVTNVLGEIVRIRGNHLMFNDTEGRIISLIEFEDAEAVADFDKEDYEKLCQLVKRYLKFTITVGIGSVHESFSQINSSYMEALVSLQNKFILGNDRVIEYDKHRAEFSDIGFYPAELNEHLLMHLRSGDAQKVHSELKEVFRYILEQRLSVDHTYMVCMSVISVCLSYIAETGYEIEEVFGSSFSPFSEIKKKESIGETQSWIEELYEQTIVYASRNRLTKARKNALAAKEYIDAHFSDPELNVDEIASRIYLNSGYLRTLFKKEMQLTVTDYITNVRLQRAKELIGTGNSKLSDVADQVGYNDASYFSKAFKKHFGITPSEYENSRK